MSKFLLYLTLINPQTAEPIYHPDFFESAGWFTSYDDCMDSGANQAFAIERIWEYTVYVHVECIEEMKL